MSESGKNSSNELSLSSLYQEILMDHQRDPRNFGELKDSNCKYEGFNPLCGDRVVIQLKLTGSKIEKAQFQGEGCSICMASASMMTEEISGKEVSHALELVHDFRLHMKGEACTHLFEGDLKALDGVSRFPVRIKCALLPWTTLKDAIEKGAQNASA